MTPLRFVVIGTVMVEIASKLTNCTDIFLSLQLTYRTSLDSKNYSFNPYQEILFHPEVHQPSLWGNALGTDFVEARALINHTLTIDLTYSTFDTSIGGLASLPGSL